MLTDEQIDQMKVGDVAYIAKSDEHGIQVERFTVTAVETRQHITVKGDDGIEFETYNVFLAQGCASPLEALKDLEEDYVDNIEFKRSGLKFKKEKLQDIRSRIMALTDG